MLINYFVLSTSSTSLTLETNVFTFLPSPAQKFFTKARAEVISEPFRSSRLLHENAQYAH